MQHHRGHRIACDAGRKRCLPCPEGSQPGGSRSRSNSSGRDGGERIREKRDTVQGTRGHEVTWELTAGKQGPRAWGGQAVRALSALLGLQILYSKKEGGSQRQRGETGRGRGGTKGARAGGQREQGSSLGAGLVRRSSQHHDQRLQVKGRSGLCLTESADMSG